MQDRTIIPPPIYDIKGWVTLEKAAEIKTKISPPERGKRMNHTTISRWQSAGYIQAIRLNDSLVLVNLEQVIEFEGLPIGKPTMEKSTIKKPGRLAKVLEVTLTRRTVLRKP